MINVLVALSAEAKPIIQHLNLSPLKPTGLFPVYSGPSLHLIISGPGMQAAAAAVSYLHAQLQQTEDCAWLNIGIAGHGQYALGQALLAHKITDQYAQQHWYPPQLFRKQVGASAHIRSVAQAELHYPDDAVYDMEAAGFSRIAVRCSTAEIVQCLKIISDNQQHSALKITAGQVSELITLQLDTITGLIQALDATSAQLQARHASSPLLVAFLQRWHFTATQRQCLNTLLRRWQLLSQTQPALSEDLRAARSSREVLHSLEQKLRQLPVRLSQDMHT